MSEEQTTVFDPDYVRDVSELVFKIRLEQDCPGNVERLLTKDNDGGAKLRRRAEQYDPLTRAYLKALGFTPPPLIKKWERVSIDG